MEFRSVKNASTGNPLELSSVKIVELEMRWTSDLLKKLELEMHLNSDL